MRNMPALGPTKRAFTTRQARRAAASGPGAGFGAAVSGGLALAETIAPRRRRNVQPAEGRLSELHRGARRHAARADPAGVMPIGLPAGAAGIAA